MEEKKTICITGGSSLLGRSIINKLKNEYILKVFSRNINKIEDIDTINGDLFDQEFLKSFLMDANYLIHAAAITNPFDSDLNIINIDMTKEIIESAIEASNLEKVIYISSENVTYNCNDPYSISKKEAELVINQYKKTLILRPSILFGRGDNRYITLFSKLIQKLPIIIIPSKKSSSIQPIHVDDVSNIIYQGIKKNIIGTYTIVGTNTLSFQELGKKIKKIKQKKTIFIPINKLFIKIGMIGLKIFYKRFYSMLRNTLFLRNTPLSEIEDIFSYKFPSIEERLKESI